MSKEKNSRWVAWMMRNYRLTFLVVGLMFILGIYGLDKMPKAEFPDFTLRTGVVVGVYPGATSEEVEEQLVRPLERYLFTFKEVKRAKTTSTSQNGICSVMVELNDDVDNKDEVWSKIKHGLNSFKSTLPQGVADVVVNDEFGDTSALLVAVESDSRDYRQLEKYCDLIGDRLRTLPSVSNVRILGNVKERISVIVDYNRLSAYGIGSQQLADALSAQGITTVSGSVSGWQKDMPVHVSPALRGEDEIAELIIYSDADNRVVRVKDVARVERGYDLTDGFIEYNGHRCVIISLEMLAGNNIVQYGRDVETMLAEIKAAELPEDVSIHTISDQAGVVSASVNSFLRDLFISMAVIILTMMILFPLSSALVASTAIPVTTFISVGIMYLAGIPLNTITLAALIVVLGMVVDDSVIVIDGYLEYLNTGMSRWHAACRSISTYFMPMLLATACISAIFFPLLLTCTGQKGDFLHDFPITIAINLMTSLFVALVVIPILLVTLIKKKTHREGHKSITDHVQEIYDRLLGWVFRHAWLTLGMAAAVLLSTVFYAGEVKRRMMSCSERDQFAVEIYLPKGTGLAETVQVADSVYAVLSRDERVRAITSFKGCASPRFQASYTPKQGGKNYAQFIVNTTSNEATEQLVDEYTERLSEAFPNAFVKFKQLDSQVFQALEFRFYGEELDSLHCAAGQLMDYMRRNPDLMWVRTDFEQPEPIVEVTPDEIAAAQLGISRQSLSLGLMSQIDARPVTTLWEGDYGMPVVLKDDRWDDAGFEDFDHIYLQPMTSPSKVQLQQVAGVSPKWSEAKIVHRNGVRCMTVTAELPRTMTAEDFAPDLQRFVEEEMRLPQGVTTEIGGEIENDEESLPQLGAGLFIAMIIIFFFLLFNFKKYKLTFVCMLVVILFIPGAMFGLFITDTTMGLTTIFGFITLMGLIMRNEILIFEHAEEGMKNGLSAREAAFEAGKRRMVPIFLTTVTTAVGVVPMIAAGSAMWKPVGITILFGGLGALVLVVTVLPVIYWKIAGKRERKGACSVSAERKHFERS